MAKEMRHEIFELKGKVIEMAKVSLSMLDDAIKALHLRDLQLAKEVDKKKHLLRDFDVQIESAALRVIALYQPMAIDLRRLATILKVITYLYRLGRYGKDIAAVVEEVSGESRLSEVLGIVHMWEHVKPMIEDAIEAFDRSDTTKIKNFEERDTEIDHMRWSVFRESVSYIMENPKNTTVCAHMIMIARYLERCGDHACKIAEKVWYMVTGEHIEIS